MDSLIHYGELRGNPFQQYRHFRRDPIRFLERTRHFGDIVRIPTMTGQASYIVHHPELIRAFLALEDNSVIKGHAAKVLGLTVGEGLLTSEGEKHHRQRRQMQPAFRSDMVREVADTILRLTDERIASWGNVPSLFVTQELMDLTLDIVFEGLFGTSVGDDRALLHQAVETAVVYSADRLMQSLPMPYWIKTKKNRKHHQTVGMLDEIVDRLLTRAESSSTATVFRHILELTTDSGEPVSRQEIRDHVVTFIIAGHETSANLLNWMLYSVANHPDVQARLRAEIDVQVGHVRPSTETIRNLPYLRQVIKETLRLYPPAWTIMRETSDTVKVNDVEIPAGSTLIIVPYAMHRNEAYFDDPLAFRPDRFHATNGTSWPQFAYLPFGAGSRTCIGNRLAQTEIALVMTRILQTYEWTVDTAEAKPEASVSLRLSGGLTAHFIRR